MTDARLTVRLLDKTLHDRATFSSGVDAMDRWLRGSVGEQIRRDRLRVWGATDTVGAFVGYYALTMHSVMPQAARALARTKERHPIPAIYLSALAVDTAHQGKGIGAALMGDAILRGIALSDQIGAAAIVLDVLKDDTFARRRAFYTALGFAEIGNDDPGRLFLSIRDAKASL